MRIAIISSLSSSPWEGCEELWAACANTALSDGHAVVASVYKWPSLAPKVAALQRKGMRVLQRKHSRFPTVDRIASMVLRRTIRVPRPHIFRNISPFKRLFDLRPDVICISQASTYDWGMWSSLIGWLSTAGVPYVVVHQANVECAVDAALRNAARPFYAGASCNAFVSLGNLKAAERQLATTLPNPRVVQNPVNLTDWTIPEWPASGPAKLACVGRLEPQAKSQDILFETLGSDVWRARDWMLRLYGKGPDQAYLKDLARHYHIADRVEFKGFVSDVRSIWADNHLLVLPSRLEGTPLTLIEAMLCGRPTVVTDVGGNAEWVEDGRSGFVAEAPTARSLSSALERAWQNYGIWESMGLVAHETAIRRVDRTPGATLLAILRDIEAPTSP